MSQLRLAGFTAVRMTSNWLPGPRAPTAGRARRCCATSRPRPASRASRSTSPSTTPARATTPLDATAQTEFAHTPPRSHGRSRLRRHDRRERAEPQPLLAAAVRAQRLERVRAGVPQLLARTYDALKAVDPGSASGAARSRRAAATGPTASARRPPRPRSSRRSASPTAPAAARRRSWTASRSIRTRTTRRRARASRTRNSTTIGLADYDKLVALLAGAFDGTAQAGLVSADPLRRVRDRVDRARRETSLYTGTEPTTTRPVDERQQAAAYDLGLRLAFCQPTVAGVLLFHSEDERALASWQSGVYYAEATPKASSAPSRTP